MTDGSKSTTASDLALISLTRSLALEISMKLHLERLVVRNSMPRIVNCIASHPDLGVHHLTEWVRFVNLTLITDSEPSDQA
jgi:hypothetical protein